MLLIWFGLLLSFAFIAFVSLRKGSYIRGGFALFAVALFAFAIWTSFQRPSVDEPRVTRESSQQGDNPWAADS